MEDDIDEEADALEFCRLAKLATDKAYQAALDSGHGACVMKEDGKLVRRFKDGTEEFIKQLQPCIPVEYGAVYQINYAAPSVKIATSNLQS